MLWINEASISIDANVSEPDAQPGRAKMRCCWDLSIHLFLTRVHKALSQGFLVRLKSPILVNADLRPRAECRPPTVLVWVHKQHFL